MRQIVKIIRKADVVKEKMEVLERETDYLLATLYQAMQEKNEKEKGNCIARLKELHNESRLLLDHI